MTDGITIRAATHADVDAILRLWLVPDVAPSSTDDAEALARAIDHPTCGVLLAERDGVPVGTVIAAWDGWRGGLYRLMVAPDLRRQGVALSLVRVAERFLAAAGCTRISVHVLGAESAAIAFWIAAGYDADERMRRFLRELRTDLGANEAGR